MPPYADGDKIDAQVRERALCLRIAKQGPSMPKPRRIKLRKSQPPEPGSSGFMTNRSCGVRQSINRRMHRIFCKRKSQHEVEFQHGIQGLLCCTRSWQGCYSR
ncbi:MAG: hypothetical protein HKN11_07030 [Rhizobiales bacterium]|nr:hypothetical protein [Hyphomicrobiales bacterium]